MTSNKRDRDVSGALRTLQREARTVYVLSRRTKKGAAETVGVFDHYHNAFDHAEKRANAVLSWQRHSAHGVFWDAEAPDGASYFVEEFEVRS